MGSLQFPGLLSMATFDCWHQRRHLNIITTQNVRSYCHLVASHENMSHKRFPWTSIGFTRSNQLQFSKLFTPNDYLIANRKYWGFKWSLSHCDTVAMTQRCTGHVALSSKKRFKLFSATGNSSKLTLTASSVDFCFVFEVCKSLYQFAVPPKKKTFRESKLNFAAKHR